MQEKFDKLSQLDRIEYTLMSSKISNFIGVLNILIITTMLSSVIILGATIHINDIFTIMIPLGLFILSGYLMYLTNKVEREYEEKLDDWLRERIK